MKRQTPLVALAVGGAMVACVATGLLKPGLVRASDHDDGETEIKARNLNLTDLYVFREKDQDATVTTSDLIFIMDSNPRSIARQQYFFNSQARYDFNIARVTNNPDAPTGKADVVLRFEFATPASNNTQRITVTAIRDGVTTSTATTSGGASILTTPISASSETQNTIALGGSTLTVFAGLKEDPFFFDVEQYFKVRASAAARAGGSTQAQVTFRSPGVDSFAGFNVNSIAVRVPLAFLQGSTTRTTFDVWETISVPSNITVQSLRKS